MDELAHTNVPGSKNAKRYQDVEDLLAAGIHVISTLNIQHLESLYDAVEAQIGVKVHERIWWHRLSSLCKCLLKVDAALTSLRFQDHLYEEYQHDITQI